MLIAIYFICFYQLDAVSGAVAVGHHPGLQSPCHRSVTAGQRQTRTPGIAVHSTCPGVLSDSWDDPCPLGAAQMPYFIDWVNHMWCGLLWGVAYATVLLVALTFSPVMRLGTLAEKEAYQSSMTWVSIGQQPAATLLCSQRGVWASIKLPTVLPRPWGPVVPGGRHSSAMLLPAACTQTDEHGLCHAIAGGAVRHIPHHAGWHGSFIHATQDDASSPGGPNGPHQGVNRLSGPQPAQGCVPVCGWPAHRHVCAFNCTAMPGSLQCCCCNKDLYSCPSSGCGAAQCTDEQPCCLCRFKSSADVEVLSRVMRAWDEDGIPLPEGVHVGEFVLKVGKKAASTRAKPCHLWLT